MANLYYCSDGSRVSEAQIKQKYSVAIRQKHVGQSFFTCQACLKERAVDNSHIISKARLKQLHKTELIWHPMAFFDSCRNCHNCWESWKSGDYLFQVNIVTTLKYLLQHDHESFLKRTEHEYDTVEKNQRLLWAIRNI